MLPAVLVVGVTEDGLAADDEVEAAGLAAVCAGALWAEVEACCAGAAADESWAEVSVVVSVVAVPF